MIIDSHCHLVLHIFDNDIEIAIKQQTTHQLWLLNLVSYITKNNFYLMCHVVMQNVKLFHLITFICFEKMIFFIRWIFYCFWKLWGHHNFVSIEVFGCTTYISFYVNLFFYYMLLCIISPILRSRIWKKLFIFETLFICIALICDGFLNCQF